MVQRQFFETIENFVTVINTERCGIRPSKGSEMLENPAIFARKMPVNRRPEIALKNGLNKERMTGRSNVRE